MNEVDIVDGIECYMNGAICDEAIIYKKGGMFYINYIGLGMTRRISKEAYEKIKEERRC